MTIFLIDFGFFNASESFLTFLKKSPSPNSSRFEQAVLSLNNFFGAGITKGFLNFLTNCLLSKWK